MRTDFGCTLSTSRYGSRPLCSQVAAALAWTLKNIKMLVAYTCVHCGAWWENTTSRIIKTTLAKKKGLLLLCQLSTMLRSMLLLMMIAFALSRLRRLRMVHLWAWLIVHKIGTSTTSSRIAFHCRVGCGKPCLIEGEAPASYHGRPRFTNYIAAAVCSTSSIMLNMVWELHDILSMIKSTAVWVASWTSNSTLRRVGSSIYHCSRTNNSSIKRCRISILSTSHHCDIMEIKRSSRIHKFLGCVASAHSRLHLCELSSCHWLSSIVISSVLLGCRCQKEACLQFLCLD